MSKEQTFEQDTIDIQLLRKVMLTMIDELAFELRKDQKLTSCLTLKIKYSNHDTHTKQVKIAYTSSERILSELCLQLFEKLYSRRMLIRLIGVRFSGLIGGSYQIDLFDDKQRDLSLATAMDHIRLRFGLEKIMRGVSL
ncbi:hypothetical protein [Rurimicrobium arvi]|uniref:DNA polymerase Y-family little finger domain-containing protein n=1 Tax=Rurimicrobium arvi TaxID=2049916 RepID=A0ABP8MYL8_9BACT